MLFDELMIRKLNRLTLVARNIRAGSIKGERRSTKRGASIEFADYRDYVAGDDLRRLDWNVYARLDRPFIKLLEEEEDLAVYILVDVSTSMNWGDGAAHKLAYALQITGALGSIALSTGDRLKIIPIDANLHPIQFGPVRGPQHQFHLLKFLEELFEKYTNAAQPSITDLNQSLRMFASQKQRSGMVFLLSDLFSPNGYETGLSNLAGRGFEAIVLHTLSPDESDPSFAGDLSLIDSESGTNLDVSIDGGILQTYRQRVTQWKDHIFQTCLKRNVRYMELDTSVPWEKVILYEMRKAALVR
jgi:uncharacterized protein (DUF58 family)